jgi:hypothetical protein
MLVGHHSGFAVEIVLTKGIDIQDREGGPALALYSYVMLKGNKSDGD